LVLTFGASLLLISSLRTPLGLSICEESSLWRRRLPRHCPKAKENLISILASASLKGEGGLYLSISGASTSLKGVGNLSHLYWVSTLKERPALGVLSVSKHFGIKVALWCPRPRRGLYNSIVSSMECLKH